MKSYKYIVLTLIQMMLVNSVKAQAVGGEVMITNAGYNGNNTADLLLRLEKDVLSKKPQLVVLMIGTNDMLNIRNMLSVKKYRENYQELITKIKKKSRLILMTIPPINYEYILQRQDPKIYSKGSPQVKVDSANTVVRELAEQNKCGLIDLYAILQACGGSGVEPESLFQNEANSAINDGVHPTANGYAVIGTAVFQAIHLSYPKVKNIVCFGDSITFGYKMKGQGTVEGQSYPAVLKRMMTLTALK